MGAAITSARCDSWPSCSRAARSAEPSTPAIFLADATTADGVSKGTVLSFTNCAATALHEASVAGTGQIGPPAAAAAGAAPPPPERAGAAPGGAPAAPPCLAATAAAG